MPQKHTWEEAALWTLKGPVPFRDLLHACTGPPWCGSFCSISSFPLSQVCSFLCIFQLRRRTHPCTGQNPSTLKTPGCHSNRATCKAWSPSALYPKTFPWCPLLAHWQFAHQLPASIAKSSFVLLFVRLPSLLWVAPSFPLYCRWWTLWSPQGLPCFRLGSLGSLLPWWVSRHADPRLLWCLDLPLILAKRGQHKAC